MFAIWALAVAVAASPAEICERAGARYGACIEEMVGAGLGGATRGGVEACTADPPTVRLYETCLPAGDCEGFLGCLESEVQAAVDAENRQITARLGDASRAERCAAHVEAGREGVALQVAVLTRGQDADAPRTCLVRGGTPEACLEPEELRQVVELEVQRQADCEAWPEPLAACILGLPGAVDCDPDEYPLWRGPLHTGVDAGAPLWSTGLRPLEYGPPALAWGPGGLLIIGDADGLRGVRDGAEVWREDGVGARRILVFDRRLVIPTEAGFEVRDAETGRRRALVLAGVERWGHGVSGGELLVVSEEGGLSRVRPERCRGQGRRCVGAGGVLPEDDLPGYSGLVTELGGWLALSDGSTLALFERGEARLTLDVGDGDEVTVVPPGHLAMGGIHGGITLLDVAACAREGALGAGCVVAEARSSGSWPGTPSAGPAGVAYNDHGFVANTVWVGVDGTWGVKTGGQGGVAVHGDHVYTLSFGHDGEGPVRLLALRLSDGSAEASWPLQDGPPDVGSYDAVAVAARDGWIAVWLGERVFVVQAR